MTLRKSLKVNSGFGHRVHRSKKNSRPYPLNKSCSIYKEKLKKLKWEVDWGENLLNTTQNGK
jgi:hypothetical protein